MGSERYVALALTGTAYWLDVCECVGLDHLLREGTQG
jgi:hypothetical protein